MKTAIFYSDDNVKIQNVNPTWNGQIGVVIGWTHDNWYKVLVNGREILLDASRNEIVKLDPLTEEK